VSGRNESTAATMSSQVLWHVPFFREDAME
jgi:hypothetical protein